MMAATIRQWESVIEQLGHLHAPDVSRVQILDLQQLLTTLDAPPAPRAVWKKFSMSKMPLRLLKAVALHLQRPGVPMSTAAVATLAASVLLTAAAAAGAVGGNTPSRRSGSSGGGGQASPGGASSSSTASANASSALSASLLLQLQQSGLLQQLPTFLSAVTQQLQHAADAAKAGRVDAGSDKPLLLLVTELLSLARQLLSLVPSEQSKAVALVPLPAVAGLVLSSLRYQTCMAAAQAAGQQQQQPGSRQQNPALAAACSGAVQLMVGKMAVQLDAFNAREGRTVGGSSSSSSCRSTAGGLPHATAAAAAGLPVEQVLCSEECFLCLAVLVIGSALPLAQQQLEGGGSSGRGSGSGASSGSAGSNGSVGSNGSGNGGNSCSPSQLPMQLMAVLQEAGCSADVAVEMAQHTVQDRTFAFRLLQGMLYTYVASAGAQECVLGLLQGRQQLGRFALLHQLMCSALLQLARMFACLDVQLLNCCSKCCVAAWSSLVRGQQQVQAQRGSSSGTGSNEQDNSGNCGQHASEQHGLAYSSCLQSAQDLLQHLLQLWGSATAALAPADAPSSLTLPGSSSSSSGGGAGTAHQASVPAVVQAADSPVVLRGISRTINVLSASLLPALYACHQTEQFAQVASAGEQQQQQEWMFVRLCSLLLQQTRMSIEAVQVSVSSSTIALRQSGQVSATALQAAAADLMHALLFIGGTRECLQLNETVHARFDLGSPGQRCQFDLLCSLLKLCSIDSNLLQQQPSFGVAGFLRMVSCIAIAAVAHVEAVVSDSAAAAQAAEASPALSADLQTAAAAAATTTTNAAAAAAENSSTCCPSPTAMLPWLVLLGRCCLLWARWLQQLSTLEHAEVAAAQGQPADQQAQQVTKGVWRVTTPAAAADPWSLLPGQRFVQSAPVSKLHCVPAGSGGTMGLSAVVECTAVAAYGWLTAGSNAQQLADLGYNLQPLLAALVQLQEDAAAMDITGHDLMKQQPRTEAERAAAEAIASAERTSLIGLCPQLQVVGQALTAFAIPLACNNPSCVNASGPSEARLVGGKACVCAGCLTARFCSRACLKQHWKVHKPVCKALAAVAAAAGGPAAGTQL